MGISNDLPISTPTSVTTGQSVSGTSLELTAVHPESTSQTAPERLQKMPEVPITSIKVVNAYLECAKALVPQNCENGILLSSTTTNFTNVLKEYNTEIKSAKASMEAFVNDHLDMLPPGTTSVSLHLVSGGGTKGVSGAPVFVVRDQNGSAVAIGKGFLKADEMIEELRSQETMKSLNLKESSTPQALGVGKCFIKGVPQDARKLMSEEDRAKLVNTPEKDTAYYLMLQTVASGRGVDDHLAAVGGADDRDQAMQTALSAVSQTAKAMAELHTKKPSAAKITPTACKMMTPDLNRQLMIVKQNLTRKEGMKTVAALTIPGVDFSILTADKPVPGDVVTAMCNRTNQELPKDPGKGAIVHADAHPGNFYFEEGSGTLSMIDLPSSSRSFDGNEGLLPAAWDSILFKLKIADSMVRSDNDGVEEGLTSDEVNRLEEAFDKAYQEAGGEPPTPIMDQFCRLDRVLSSLAQFSTLLKLHPGSTPEGVRIEKHIGYRMQMLHQILKTDITSPQK